MNKHTKTSTISPIEFIDSVIKLNEKGLPWKLAPYQRRVLSWLSAVEQTALWLPGYHVVGAQEERENLHRRMLGVGLSLLNIPGENGNNSAGAYNGE